jgi:hypothetical protein
MMKKPCQHEEASNHTSTWQETTQIGDKMTQGVVLFFRGAPPLSVTGRPIWWKRGAATRFAANNPMILLFHVFPVQWDSLLKGPDFGYFLVNLKPSACFEEVTAAMNTNN